jgi:hypothetical protein
MAVDSHIHRGIVHGRTIQLDDDTGLPDGQEVTVTVAPIISGAQQLRPGEGLRQAFGAWAEEAEELDQFLNETRRSRRRPRREIEP